MSYVIKKLAKPLSGIRIVICGKGGCGKSSILTLMAKILKDSGYEIHVLDGDASNSGLYRMLGFNRDPKPLVEYFGGKTFKGEEGKVSCPVDDPTPLDKNKISLEKIPPKYFVKKDHITLFISGKIMGIYEGCHGPESKVTRDFVLPGNEVTLIDIEAGVEHFGRGIEVNSDIVIVVVDPNYTSFQIAENVKKMVTEMRAGPEKLAKKMTTLIAGDINVAREVTKDLRVKYYLTILNKVDSPEIEVIMRGKLKERGIKAIGSVRYDPEVSRGFLEAVPIGKCKAEEDVKKIVAHLEREVEATL